MIIEYTYKELKELFRSVEKSGKQRLHICGFIVFSQEIFKKQFSEHDRTYYVSSDNKAYQPNKGGYSIYGNCLDGKDLTVRLEQYMADELAGDNGWKVEKCYIDTDYLVGGKLAMVEI